MHGLLRLFCALVCSVTLGAGSTAFTGVSAAFADDAGAAAEPAAGDIAPYRISRGDELNFRFFYTPEINTVAQVRTDGRVALPLIGELRVEGLSIAELTALVEQRLAGQVRRPQATVNVQGASTLRVFVGGEVMRPGVQPLVGPLTALQAVMVAEGLRESAQPRQAVVLRRGPKGERLALPLDLASIMSGSGAAQDLELQPYDVVVIPRSGISDLNVWIDQYVRRMLPFGFGFSYSINRNAVSP